ncbi:MAG: hypothetical protein NTZ33_00840 [Bacteroidetes bacterium]|nr:hypothetical protein [Bacteroidota bacterium]
MKKQILVGLFLISFVFNVYSQTKGKFRISALTEISFFKNKTLTSYGFSGEFFVHRNFSLNYQYSIGYNQSLDTYMHYPGTVAGLVEMFRTDTYYFSYSANSENDWVYLLFITVVIPEGVSFHTYPRKWLEIAPFVNPFAADFNILDNRRSTITLSLGIRLHIKPVPNFSISPHFGLKHIYRNGNVGSFYGLSMGVLF